MKYIGYVIGCWVGVLVAVSVVLDNVKAVYIVVEVVQACWVIGMF